MPRCGMRWYPGVIQSPDEPPQAPGQCKLEAGHAGDHIIEPDATRYGDLAKQLATEYGLSAMIQNRIELELHKAHQAGKERKVCQCRACQK